MANEACMLTTFDNPYDPFNDFVKWFLFDIEKGYNTCDYLGRILRTSDEFTEEENQMATEDAIDEIIKYDFRNIYKKVRMDESKDSPKRTKTISKTRNQI